MKLTRRISALLCLLLAGTALLCGCARGETAQEGTMRVTFFQAGAAGVVAGGGHVAEGAGEAAPTPRVSGSTRTTSGLRMWPGALTSTSSSS